MGQIVTIGSDVAKSIFQVHGVDAVGEVVLRRQVRRGQMLSFFASPRVLVGIEACATAYYWGRDCQARSPGAPDAAQLRQAVCEAAEEPRGRCGSDCEAVTRPTIRFVEVKSPEQQSVMMLHRMRMMLMRQRVALSNAIRGHMAEFGLVAPLRQEGLHGLVQLIIGDERVPGRRGCA